MRYFLTLLLVLASSAHSATIGVLDYGIDYTHPDLASKMWINPNKGQGGEFSHAINGWSFINRNNEIFDFGIMDIFNPDIVKPFFVEALSNEGKLSPSEKKDLARSQNTQKYQIYSQLAHGSHVAGIAVKDSDHQLIGMTYLTLHNPPEEDTEQDTEQAPPSTDKTFSKLIEEKLKHYTDMNADLTQFLQQHRVDIINGSFSSDYYQVYLTVSELLTNLYQKEPFEEEIENGIKLYQSKELANYKKLLAAGRNTLFVFAAGNESTNNDLYPSFPANVNADNSITVAATYGTSSLADFSNYGLHSVDVAAPGVNIYSAAPGFGRIPMSGTSMATPLVSRLAGLIKDTNSKLTPGHIQKILPYYYG